jgi:hypothetical protein
MEYLDENNYKLTFCNILYKIQIDTVKKKDGGTTTIFCIACVRNSRSVAFISCGHYVTCLPCGHGMTECPVYQSKIMARVRESTSNRTILESCVSLVNMPSFSVNLFYYLFCIIVNKLNQIALN